MTKNGYDTMAVLSLEQYASLTNNIESKLNEADYQAFLTEKRLSHETIFKNVKSAIYKK